MPNWKKLIVSGSAGSLSSLTVDNNISANSISSSGAITGSDTYIDDWGSVSASLASISSSAISIPTLQQVTEQGSSTDQQINITGALTASGLIYPTADGSDKEVLVTDGSGNLTFERPNVYANVKNKSGATLLKGTPVHASSSVGNLAEVIAASASVASTMPATFVLNEDLADEAQGLAVVTGFLNGVDTSAFSEGDVIYVAADGGYTNVKPTGSSNLIQNLGIVINVDASNGSGFIYGSGRSNDIPNLPTSKIWVGSDEYSVTSSVVHLDESNGRLGIGTTSPQAELHVEGDISGSGNVTITRSDSTEAVFTLNTDRSFGRTFTITNDGLVPTINAQDAIKITADDGAAEIKLDASGQDYISFRASTGEDMRLTANGYLGIGTTSPQAELHVEGDISGSGNLTISDHNYASNNGNRIRITPNYEKATGTETGIYFYGNRTGSYSSNVSTYHFANDLRVATTGSAYTTSDHINFFNRLTTTEGSRYDDLYGFFNQVKLTGDSHTGDQAVTLWNQFQITGTGNITNDEVYANISTVDINNPNSTVGVMRGLQLGNTLTAGSGSAYYGIDFDQSVNSNYHISGDYALLYSNETSVPTVGGSTYNIYLPAAMESYLGGDLNIGQAISASGAITGSDVKIDDWGSVSASLASISSSAISTPTLQQVTDQGTTTDNTIILDSNSADSPSIRFIDSSDITFNLYNDGGNIFTITRQDNGGADFRVVADSSNYTGSYIQVGNGSTYGKDATIVGDLTVQGTVTAQEFHTEFVSASIIYESGSTKFGDTQDDNHDFTGSLNISGSINLPDNVKAQFGSGTDLEIYHNGSNSFIDQTGTGNLYIRNLTNDADIIFESDDGSGGVTNYFYLDGSQTQTIFSQNGQFQDNVRLKLGSGGDLQILHTGTASTISNSTGTLTITNSADDEDILFRTDDGSGGVTDYLRLDGSATNIKVYKNLKAEDNVKLIAGSGDDLRLYHNTTNSVIENITGNLSFTQYADDSDIIFQSDDGSGGVTNYLTLDGSTTNAYFSNPGNFGIGTTSPSYKLDVAGDLRVLSSSINYQENTDVDTGTETIATVNTGSFDGAFFDYLIKSGSNLRAGTVTAVHDGTNVEYNEVSTQDLGSTSVVELSVDISGADMRLRATTTSDDWLIKSLVRTL